MDMVTLREVELSDLDIFFMNQLDPAGIHMAAFTAEDPADRPAFERHWAKIMAEETIMIRTVLYNERVAGSILSHSWFGEPEVSYWFGREFWGKGIATAALQAFLTIQTIRPLFARVAYDNMGSLRVLEKCGFVETGRDKGYAHGRGTLTEEIILRLD